MGAAAIGLQAAGTGLGVYGAYQQGRAQQAYYEYLANKSDQQAIAEREAGDVKAGLAQDEGAIANEARARTTRSTVGKQKAAAGANGTSGSVTSIDIDRDTFNRSKMDELAIRYNADMKAWNAKENARLNAWNLEQEAAGYRAAGKQAKRGAKLGMLTSLVGGSGQVADTYLRFKR